MIAGAVDVDAPKALPASRDRPPERTSGAKPQVKNERPGQHRQARPDLRDDKEFTAMTTTHTRKKRRVRVTLEGSVTVETKSHVFVTVDDATIRVRKASVDILELVPEYRWTNGDVVQFENLVGSRFTIERDSKVYGGEQPWRCASGGRWSDDTVTRLVAGLLASHGPALILRYQADES